MTVSNTEHRTAEKWESGGGWRNQNFPPLYGKRKFSTVFITAHH